MKNNGGIFMIKSKKFSKILVSLILILVTSFGVLFVAMQVNKTNTDTILSVSAVSDTTENNLSFNKNYDIINYNRASDEYDKVTYYSESPWNGRIQSFERHFTNSGDSRSYVLETNVDVRDILLFNDDVIVEFKFYSQAPTIGTKRSEDIGYFEITASFYSNGSSDPSVVKHKDGTNKSSYGVTIQGGQKTTKVVVDIYYTFYNGSKNVRAKSIYTFEGAK